MAKSTEQKRQEEEAARLAAEQEAGQNGGDTTTEEEQQQEATLLVTLNPEIDLMAYEFEDGTGIRQGVPKRITESVYATNGEKKLDGRKIMVKA